MRRLICVLLVVLLALPLPARAGSRGEPLKKKATPTQTTPGRPIKGQRRKGSGGTSNNGLTISYTLPTTGNRTDGSTRQPHTYSTVCAATFTVKSIILLHWETWEPDGTDPNGNPKQILRTYDKVSLPCGNGYYEVTRCTNTCPPGTPPPPPPPPPRDVALLLADSINYHTPDPTFSPDTDRPNAKVLVGLPFFWAVPTIQFETLYLEAWACNETACVRAWAQATPEYLYFNPGDSTETITTCHRPGDIIRSKTQMNTAPDDCTYTYDTAGPHTATIGIHYAINGGASNGATYTFDPQDSEIDTPIPVTEYQPVIIR